MLIAGPSKYPTLSLSLAYPANKPACHAYFVHFASAVGDRLVPSMFIGPALMAGPILEPPPAPPSADKAVVLTGWTEVEDFTMANVVVTVEVNGETRPAP
jgi:hypothetical protein